MAKINGKHWRSRGGTSWTKLIWSSVGRIGMGKTIRGRSIRTWMGQRTQLRLYVGSSRTRVISVKVDDIKMAGQKQKMVPMWKKLMKKRWSWGTNIISWPWKLGLYSTWTQTKWNNYWTVDEDVWITNFCWNNWKITGAGKASRKNCSVVLRHGRTCSEMRWTKRWTGKQESWATLQSFKSLLGFKQEELESVGELSEVCSHIFLKCGQQVCKISHWMDSGMWQTIRKIDFLQSSHKRIPTIWSCGYHGIAL